MITLPFEYQSGKTLLAELDAEHYITHTKKVVAKLTADNLWAKPVNPIQPTGHLLLLDSEYEHLTASWERFEEWLVDDVAKHLAGKHEQKTHGGKRASSEAVSFSDSELSSIATYSGTATQQINHKLRGLSNKGKIRSVFDLSDNEIDTTVSNLDSAIDKSRLTTSMTLQRELPISSLKSGLFGSVIGKTISDKGFLSLRNTNSVIPARTGFARFKIIAPADTKALDLSFLNQNAMGEVIFPRNTKIKITSVIGNAPDMVVRGEIVE